VSTVPGSTINDRLRRQIERREAMMAQPHPTLQERLQRAVPAGQKATRKRASEALA
jgi:hypothetical protein